MNWLRPIGLATACAAFSGCVSLPPLEGRLPSVTIEGTAATRLGRTVTPLVRAHPGTSGIATLTDGPDAFAARVLLADAAERTIDAQYYIWHGDMTGTLLFAALRRAADRGVRVRLLVDDLDTKGLDGVLAVLDAHPNIEVRLFNPAVHRGWQRMLDFVLDFGRMNHRMHNKSFTVDNQVTIVGGRNVADEYFGAGEGLLFADLDVVAVGPVVSEVSHDFDRYWASMSSYPAERIVAPPNAGTAAALDERVQKVADDTAANVFRSALLTSPVVRLLLEARLPLEWAVTTLLSDDPAKGLGAAPDSTLMWTRLRQRLGAPRIELDLVSPYFVPGKEGVEYLAGLAQDGVKVQVLTNSLETTDVLAVHAGYAKRRGALLKEGVSLYEMKRPDEPPAAGGADPGSPSSSRLHAKAFAVDRARIFVGSFNFDPRSARLNTEMGLVIETPTLARAISKVFVDSTTAYAYRVRRDTSGRLEWWERRDRQDVVHHDEPGTSFWKRLLLSILSFLPIEWLL
ncbi:MAG: phospholipase active site motif protein 5 [Gemmatimonadetes bacterium]|jgi:putative cardiolipin synthase|nr:phospholipase active site motif protein 5 [Gemmatimonadota bacterium]